MSSSYLYIPRLVMDTNVVTKMIDGQVHIRNSAGQGIELNTNYIHNVSE